MSKKNNQTRQAFLLTFFPDKNKPYEELPINGFTLVKHIVNGDPTHFEVAIYPPGALKKSQESLAEYKDNHLTPYQQFTQALARETD